MIFVISIINLVGIDVYIVKFIMTVSHRRVKSIRPVLNAACTSLVKSLKNISF